MCVCIEKYISFKTPQDNARAWNFGQISAPCVYGGRTEPETVRTATI